MRLTKSPATTYREGSQDGTPHFTYFIAESQLSFTWDGHFACPVEVEHGGYGEVLIASARIDESDFPERTTAHEWLQWFACLCQSIALSLKEES